MTPTYTPRRFIPSINLTVPSQIDRGLYLRNLSVHDTSTGQRWTTLPHSGGRRRHASDHWIDRPSTCCKAFYHYFTNTKLTQDNCPVPVGRATAPVELTLPA